MRFARRHLTPRNIRETPAQRNVSAIQTQPSVAGAEGPAATERRAWLRLTWWDARRRVALLLGVLGLLLGTSMIDESPTTDEPLHLTRGLAYFWGPDASLSYSHPPLGNAFGALPVALTGSRVDMGSLRGYAEGEVWNVARDLLSSHYGKRRPWFFEARAAIALTCVLLAFYVYRLALRFFGQAAALWALAFFALHPTLIAHGRLITTDMPVTVAMVIAVGELARFLSGDSRRHGLWAALAVGVALVTKYTGTVLVPLASLAVLVVACLRIGRYRGLTLGRALAAGAGFIVVSAACALLVINAAYRFELSGLTAAEMLARPEPAPDEPRGYGGDVLERASILPKLPSGFRVPLPYTYVFGLSVLRAHEGDGHTSWFMGRPMQHGHLAYFPVMLLIKTPACMLAALGYAAYLFWRKRGRVGLAAGLMFGYAACLLLLAMRAGINIGVRHVLPIMPILAVFAGVAAARALAALPGERLRQRASAALIGASVLGVVWSFPDYLSDFNLLVAGKLGGERISVVGEEWGQDTARLGRALRERDIKFVYFTGDSFASRLELARQKVIAKRLGCVSTLPNDAYVAIRLREVARRSEGCSKWTRSRTPEFDVRGHVFVYRTSANEQPFLTPAETARALPDSVKTD